MSSLAAFLQSRGYDAQLHFLRHGQKCDFFFLENVSTPQVIVAKPNFKDYQEFITALRFLKPHSDRNWIFFCGPYATINAETIIGALPWLDGVLFGQPEETAADLLDSIVRNRPWATCCNGGIWREEVTRRIHRLLLRRRTKTLNDLPFPIRTLESDERGNYCNIEASRGCMFQCSFCHVPVMRAYAANMQVRDTRDPVRVVDEIENIVRSIGKTLFIFNDPCFWSSPKDDERVLQFCSEVQKRSLDIRLYIYLRCHPFPGRDVLEALVHAGLTRVFLGIENVSERTQKTFHKRINPYSYESLKALLDPYDVNIHIGYITIEPHSSVEEVRRSIDYLYAIRELFRIGVITEPVRIIPGTPLFRQLLREGLLDTGLSFDRMTYGYKFLHEEVGQLLRLYQRIFGRTLKKEAYWFEYYSTTIELLRVLAIRIRPEVRVALEAEYRDFHALRDAMMDHLYQFFRTTLILAEKQQLGAAAGAAEDFAMDFQHTFPRVQATFQHYQESVVRLGAERAVREISPGLDPLS